MNNQINKLIPKLRFSEFNNNDTWKKVKLADILFEHGFSSTGKEKVFSVSVNKGIINQIEHLGRSYSASNTEKYNRVLPGDIVYTKSPTGNFPFGIIKQNKILKDVIVSPLYGVFSPKTKELGYILDSYFESVENTHIYLSPIIQKGAKNTINIKNETFLSNSLLIPIDYEEQKKIASCLLSIDNLISANNDKLLNLKSYKKGLLQNLFPVKGKKVPKLRFKEFEKSDDWTEKELNKLAKRILAKNSKGAITAVFTNSAINGIVDQKSYFDRDIVNKNNLENYYIVNQSDYVYNPRVSSSAPVGPISKNKTNKIGVMSPLYTVFQFLEKENDFYEYYFQSSHWHSSIKKISNSGARFDRINITALNFMKIPILLTNQKEQQKIAETLSSLDDLIKEQSNKIEQLKLHKKGLVQGLFPKMMS